MIVITSKKEGFRRAGIAHSERPTEYPDDHFDKKQMAELREEPTLIVQENVADSDAIKAMKKSDGAAKDQDKKKGK